MAIVSSFGALTAIAPSQVSSVRTSGPFYDGYRRSYAEIYRTQPAVRTVIDFLARNIAQLGLHVFRRVSDTDRERLHSHGLARAVSKPNPQTTRYRLIDTTVRDLCKYANAYWLKVRGPRFGLVRLPAGEVSVEGGLLPLGYEWTPAGGGKPQQYATSEIVHFRDEDLVGFPPIETLRQVLAEAIAAGAYRESFWRNSARFEGVIERPAGAPVSWNKDQFRKDWQEFAGSRAGVMPVLEDGMTLRQVSFTAKDSQYLESLKLTREFVAAQYHIPLPMVGILDHATFSNIREQHKQLYQDCLGPWLVMLVEDIELQLLPEFENGDDVYVEFNIQAKLSGSFEEQAASLQGAIGRPYMTVNEGRARLNLPRDPNPTSDRIAEAAPGQAAPPPSTAVSGPRALLGRFFVRQQARVEKAEPDERAAAFDLRRWDRELASDLEPLLGAAAGAVAADINRQTLAALERGEAPWTNARLDALVRWIEEAQL